MKKALCILLILTLVAPPSHAFAWAEVGHHIISLMAFDLLLPEERAKITSILEKHPRYGDDFVPPKGLPNETEEQRWRIGRVGYWPDVIRRNLTYDRPTWHYEIGPALVIGDRNTLKIPQRPGPLPAEATLETTALHLSQAFELCQKTLADKAKPDAERAIALCWVTHLAGDAHQPCHAGSLFMEKVFVDEDGDRGANRVLTKQRNNMHALWDQLLGNEFTLDGTRKRIFEITSDEELVARAKQALLVENGLDRQTWLAESRATSAKFVYAPEILDSLNLVARGLIKEPEPIDVPEEYLKTAGRIAQGRAIEAAYRLAATWRKALE